MQTASKEIKVLLIDDDGDDFILIRELLSDVSPPEFKVGSFLLGAVYFNECIPL
jgi:hypothetical protein